MSKNGSQIFYRKLREGASLLGDVFWTVIALLVIYFGAAAIHSAVISQRPISSYNLSIPALMIVTGVVLIYLVYKGWKMIPRYEDS